MASTNGKCQFVVNSNVDESQNHVKKKVKHKVQFHLSKILKEVKQKSGDRIQNNGCMG